MKILLDTHIFLWLIDNDVRLKTQWLNEIKNPNNEIFLSVASVWECIIKYQIGKLSFPESPEIYLPEKRKENLIKSSIIIEGNLRKMKKKLILL